MLHTLSQEILWDDSYKLCTVSQGFVCPMHYHKRFYMPHILPEDFLSEYTLAKKFYMPHTLSQEFLHAAYIVTICTLHCPSIIIQRVIPVP